MNFSPWILLLVFSFCNPALARVRRVEATQDQIVTVKTALGIATIVQVPDRPNSIVVGDQAGFKVEYLDQAITIKPLRGGAKSNLYIYTDYRRYNVQLVTGAEASADYVVYLDNPTPKLEKNMVHWMAVKRSTSVDGANLSVNRVARTRDGILLIEFRLSSREKLDPKWIWLTQAGMTRPIQNLFLSSLEAKEPATGTIQVLQSDVNADLPLKIELRKKKTASISLPKVAAWR
jgi:hypothetical protein